MAERDLKYKEFVEDDIKNNKGILVNCCEELKYTLNNPKETQCFTKNYLNTLLTYATTFSDYYKPYSNYKSILDFPIVNKEILKTHWNEIAVLQYSDEKDNCIKYTSGSTGTPFKMVMDHYKHCRWIAGNKVFRENVGVRSHEKTVFISCTVADKNIPIERQDKDNVYYFDCKYLDEEKFSELLQYISDNDVRTITAMASVLEQLARYIEEKKISWNKEPLLAVFSVSEALKNKTRIVISKFFSCNVYILYANEENGVLGVEDGSGYGCRANSADFYFEVLSLNSDEPVEEGELGRLIITDLFNRAFPIIRYENGDLVSIKTMPDGKVYITDIAGRKIDILYTTDGRMVHYFNGISFLEPYMDIKQFQLIQEDYHNFTWVLNTDNHSYEEMIIEECKKLFGTNSNWKFQYVSNIPKLQSGKQRMTVCNIKDITR